MLSNNGFASVQQVIDSLSLNQSKLQLTLNTHPPSFRFFMRGNGDNGRLENNSLAHSSVPKQVLFGGEAVIKRLDVFA